MSVSREISRSKSQKEAESCDPFAPFRPFFETNPFGRAIANNVGATFNLVFAHCVFWAIAFPTAQEYGYNDDNRNSEGAIPSGTRGSGAAVIISLLFIVANVIWAFKIIWEVIEYEHELAEAEEAAHREALAAQAEAANGAGAAGSSGAAKADQSAA